MTSNLEFGEIFFKIKEIPNFSKDFSGVRYGNCVNQGSLKEQNLQKKNTCIYTYLYIEFIYTWRLIEWLTGWGPGTLIMNDCLQ